MSEQSSTVYARSRLLLRGTASTLAFALFAGLATCSSPPLPVAGQTRPGYIWVVQLSAERAAAERDDYRDAWVGIPSSAERVLWASESCLVWNRLSEQPLRSTGDVTLTYRSQQWRLDPVSDGLIYPANSHLPGPYDGIPGGRYLPGELLTVSTTGGDVPAFSVSAPLPPHTVFDQPPEPERFTIPRTFPLGRPLVLHWSGSPPLVHLYVDGASQVHGARIVIDCFFDGALHQAQLPAEQTAWFRGAMDVFVLISASDRRVFYAGDALIEMVVDTLERSGFVATVE